LRAPPPPRGESAALETKKFAKGTVLFREGDFADNAYIVKTGSVALSRRNRSGQDQAFLTLRTGEIVGEMALIVDIHRTATAVIKDDCEAIVINRDNFNYHLDRLNPFILRILRLLVKRLKDTTDAYMEF
jgi:CRP/FNR family cyclic AMP-dependent transcriptional regulator